MVAAGVAFVLFFDHLDHRKPGRNQMEPASQFAAFVYFSVISACIVVLGGLVIAAAHLMFGPREQKTRAGAAATVKTTKSQPDEPLESVEIAGEWEDESGPALIQPAGQEKPRPPDGDFM